MTNFDFTARARLYLGSDRTTALSLGAKTFKTAAAAIRFAMEEAAPVSLRGALLVVGAEGYSGEAIRALYSDPAYPLCRNGAAAPDLVA
ncbi:hypothetical protein [Pelagibacterium xiamenense]|uniref:hypothetical protein n=1 Tax=Pelagibacterium xiamenense TaxID=2901140 RepID=UPI001E365C90|nr:hypothetical protein [Pelagibacterium xiamenense]MCD7059449.1 hypothetical protein [Pelagibacterium xiamenense]